MDTKEKEPILKTILIVDDRITEISGSGDLTRYDSPNKMKNAARRLCFFRELLNDLHRLYDNNI